MSATELRTFATHCRTMAKKLEPAIADAQAQIPAGARRNGKATARARLAELLKEHSLWLQLADEIRAHQGGPL